MITYSYTRSRTYSFDPALDPVLTHSIPCLLTRSRAYSLTHSLDPALDPALTHSYLLTYLGYKSFIDVKKAKKDEEVSVDEDDDVVSSDSLDRGYDNLLSMKIWSLTMEKVNELVHTRNGKKNGKHFYTHLVAYSLTHSLT